MYQNNILIHKQSGELLRLVRIRKSNVNTFIQVDSTGNPIIKKRSWSTRPEEQLRLIKGFDNLEIKTMTQREVLKAMRALTGKNMTEFGKMVGLDHSRISKYENEKYAITLPMFLEWCDKIEKKPEEIFAQLK